METKFEFKDGTYTGPKRIAVELKLDWVLRVLEQEIIAQAMRNLKAVYDGEYKDKQENET